MCNDKNLLLTYLPTNLLTCKRYAFTLAEVLITLGIIGVVAAITMPTLVANVTERVNSSREANIAQKITKATDQMKALGLMDGSYNTTDEFVDELQKYLKIAKRCSADNIDACWPTKTVKTADGEEFEVKNARTGKNLNLKSNTSNNVGIVLADGASIILTYNQDSQGIDESDAIVANKKSLPVGGGKSEEFAYTTSTTGAIDFVMDVNGGKGPNSETINNKFYDIRSFKAAKFSKGCAGVEVAGIGCVVPLSGKYTRQEARDSCSAIGMTLPDRNTLQLLNTDEVHSAIPAGTYISTSGNAEDDAQAVVVSEFNGGFVRWTDRYTRFVALCIGE